MRSTFVLAALLWLAAAQTSVVSIPFYILDTQSIEASIISANPSATTMALNCPAGTDASDCGLFPEMILIYGPSTYHLDMGVGDAQVFTGSVDCNRAATVTCIEFASGSEANFPGSSTTTYESEEILTLPVTVTSGAEKLGAQASATGSAQRSASTSGSSAASGSAASSSTASVTQIVGTSSAIASGTSHTSGVTSASATPSTGAASANVAISYSAFVGAAAVLLLS
ncbi:uncharacterized protein M421DRAFT_77394 [Didymella exigua CBS 183.55]|uniref:GPI anchored protein n=1 Tax=Didymella exigua CBS 183.55 TaxID=1150837 RepID=A0A6A5RA07_9PLEO|nr:uncharacterized protein M421DRAFT_77394 [Didymella exigua CBS 183.55]KAF1922677.1 hypothetical protein M421DRAFT_77394 [Didymella exigua CBS 183.55]